MILLFSKRASLRVIKSHEALELLLQLLGLLGVDQVLNLKQLLHNVNMNHAVLHGVDKPCVVERAVPDDILTSLLPQLVENLLCLLGLTCDSIGTNQVERTALVIVDYIIGRDLFLTLGEYLLCLITLPFLSQRQC